LSLFKAITKMKSYQKRLIKSRFFFVI